MKKIAKNIVAATIGLTVVFGLSGCNEPGMKEAKAELMKSQPKWDGILELVAFDVVNEESKGGLGIEAHRVSYQAKFKVLKDTCAYSTRKGGIMAYDLGNQKDIRSMGYGMNCKKFGKKKTDRHYKTGDEMIVDNAITFVKKDDAWTTTTLIK